MKHKITLPESFPKIKYVPFGYLDNPYHSAVYNRSGIVRSVPPVGFGFWARRMPWAYGEGTMRNVNYLSFLHLSFYYDGVALHELVDYKNNNIELYSAYHTKNIMSYNFNFNDIEFDAKYILHGENSIVCILDLQNQSDKSKEITIHATNIYGFIERRWWGIGGTLGNYNDKEDMAISKIWSYGDIFALSSDRKSIARKATFDEEEWNTWIRNNNVESSENVSKLTDDAVYNMMSYKTKVEPNSSENMVIALSRNVNETYTVRNQKSVVANASELLKEKIDDDKKFYDQLSMLTGDWDDNWKQGWVYDYETLRMTIRQPLGIYKHHWDGMQIFTPRAVLGESALDMMCYSYADIEMAKEVIFGTFADAVDPNVPCSREDGSVNMIGESGQECGTAPTWGLPFHVILSIYNRDKDDEWIKKLYPYLKSYLEWWLENRTDEDGWFHCDNSWESGQDGSKRFLIAENEEGKTATYVRTVDVEATMANAFNNMIAFANIAGEKEDIPNWERLAKERIERTQNMFVEGWFRDFDARTEKPIILKDYYDVMMLLPLAVGVATTEQIESIKPMFSYFEENPKYWLDWPSFMFPFTEAAWNAGLYELTSKIIFETGNRIYERNTDNNLKTVGTRDTGLPKKYNYRIPGVATEFWPIEMDEKYLNGCENYGWGATLPTLVIRNIIGFRETIGSEDNFLLSPSLPVELLIAGKTYGISNLKWHGHIFDLNYKVRNSKELMVELKFQKEFNSAKVKLNGNHVSLNQPNCKSLLFEASNFEKYEIEIN